MRTAMWCAPVGGLMLAMSVSLAAAAPDEELLGKSAGYPVGTRASWFYEERRVVQPCRYTVPSQPSQEGALAAAPSCGGPGADAQLQVRGSHARPASLPRSPAHHRLLIIKDGQILLERYQYDRLPTHRLVSHSMAKSIVCLAIGLALAEGRIASLDDKVSKYVPELAGYPYGETSIRNILRMASGVRFSEVYDGKDDVARLARVRAVKGAVEALRIFTTREAEEGSRFHYASSETVVLALVVRAATGMTLSDYLAERLWQAMGLVCLTSAFPEIP